MRELGREVLSQPRGSGYAVKKLRDSHHAIARLLAFGLRDKEVARRIGFSINRLSVLKADPAMQDLIAQYRATVDEAHREALDEYFEIVSSNRVLAARLINDKLVDAEPEGVTFAQLVSVHADAADRTGYPKRSVALNINVDFAAQLDRAIRRSGVAPEAREVPSPYLALEAPGPAPVSLREPALESQAEEGPTSFPLLGIAEEPVPSPSRQEPAPFQRRNL